MISPTVYSHPIPMTTQLNDVIEFDRKQLEKYYYTPNKCKFYNELEKYA